MSYLLNNQQKVNDIIFARRNKNYGAYAIRSAYGNTVLRSLTFMMLGFGTIMSLAFYFSNRPEGNQNGLQSCPIQDTAMVTPYNFPEPDIAKKPEPKTQQGGGHTEKGIGTVISNSATSESTSTAVSTGPVTNTLTGVGPDTPSATVNATTTVTYTTTFDPPVLIPDSLPEFEGGYKALVKFIGSQLKYPAPAFEGGVEGTVYVKFVVDQYGKVGNLSLLNNEGYGMDEEAMRVVGMIPKFKKPGKVNGKAVRVYYQVPIKFKLSK